ncbi:hypothetical protein LTR97_006765 [Elasticomyces elasticus]|uniref:Bicarbonate transporter-like transmembrane domain-containing protein n=1 Tax=Elasticomyces elasticus TaxID=574655 RepID=A0AAN7ZTV5_9PEZI|nr:hypothetical protein LTR97_006765 [Elasticomyces elasticus]
MSTRTSRVSKTISAFRKDGILRPFRLLSQDLHNFSTRYISDWTVFNQLVFASAVYVFFTNILPGLTFASDLYVLTGENWGAIEVIFSTGLCGVIFSLFSIQPLTILGVTGPFSVLAENIYTLCNDSFGIDFLQFMAWSLIHAGWMHVFLAIFNAHDWTMLYVTEFSCEIFSLLNSIIYFHKAVQELERAHANLDLASFLCAIIGAVGTFELALFLTYAERWPPILHRYVRLGLREYAAAISIIFFIGIPYAGELHQLDKDRLYTSSQAFRPTKPGREHFYVRFWELPVGWVFAALVPGAIITILFFFDHEISGIICTINRYGVRKPTGYAQDIVLLGLTTALCGILGIPPSNGPSYWHIHGYTLFQILATVVVFVVTLTKGGPAFPVLIILLVPFRLLAMGRIWNKDVLRYVDRWACRDGCPEGNVDDRQLGMNEMSDDGFPVDHRTRSGEDSEVEKGTGIDKSQIPS